MSGLVIVVGDEVNHVVAKCASFLLIEETREIKVSTSVANGAGTPKMIRNYGVPVWGQERPPLRR